MSTGKVEMFPLMFVYKDVTWNDCSGPSAVCVLIHINYLVVWFWMKHSLSVRGAEGNG